MLDYPGRFEQCIDLRIDPVRLFDALDDHQRLAEHMTGMSWMMGGGKMTLEVDKLAGREVGSVMKLVGTAFGMHVELTEQVTDRVRPLRKSWKTIDAPDLIIIGDYEMGFEIAPSGSGSRLAMRIAFAPSPRHPWLSRLLGGAYARWCVGQMLRPAEKAASTAGEER